MTQTCDTCDGTLQGMVFRGGGRRTCRHCIRDHNVTNHLATTLRDAIAAADISARQLGLATGVDQTLISRFILGADIRLGTASRLAEYLGVSMRRGKSPAAAAPKPQTGRPPRRG